MKISLSILNSNFSNLEKSVGTYINSCDYIHMDVMDGEFVPNISIGPDIVSAFKPLTDKPFDTHLMILNPIKYIKQFVDAGSKYITFHVEANSDVIETIELIHSYGVKAGISIKPGTEVEEIEKYLPLVDMVLVMSVEPGFGGQKFMESSIDKCKKLKELRDKNNYNYLINIDGGINDKTLPLVKDYLDLAVVGSYITKSSDPIERINIIHNI